LAGHSFENSGILQQCVDYETDGSAPQTHQPRQIGARDRLILVYQVQRNLAVDLARRPLLGYLKLVRVYSAHNSSVVVQLLIEQCQPASSEDKLEPHLNVSPWRSGGDLAEARIRTRETSERDAGVVEVRLVESVEEIGLELKLCSFGDVEQFAG